MDDSGSDELSRLEETMAASKKAVAEEGSKEKKAAAATKKKKRPAAAPSVSDPGDKKAAVATPLLKRPATAKRPAAALGKFDIDAFAAYLLSSKEAQSEPRRKYYTSKLHHRSYKAALQADMSNDDALTLRA